MNLEPIREVLALIQEAKRLTASGAPMCLRDANAAQVFTTVFVGAPALSQLLEAVTNLEKLEAEWRAEANAKAGGRAYRATICLRSCADSLKRLLHPEDK